MFSFLRNEQNVWQMNRKYPSKFLWQGRAFCSSNLPGYLHKIKQSDMCSVLKNWGKWPFLVWLSCGDLLWQNLSLFPEAFDFYRESCMQLQFANTSHFSKVSHCNISVLFYLLFQFTSIDLCGIYKYTDMYLKV